MCTKRSQLSWYRCADQNTRLFLPDVGRGGQKFLERCVPKVAELRARFPHKDIEVDGGVGPKTISVCADAGECGTERVYTRSSSANRSIAAVF